ncbi:MAG: L,D-transpeptidase, partial [Pseudomonadota bacterium]
VKQSMIRVKSRKVPLLLQVTLLLLMVHHSAVAGYGEQYCGVTGYSCINVQKGDSWEKLFPDETQRDVVKTLNRMNTRLRTGKTIAVPENLENLTLMDISPFEQRIKPGEGTRLFVEQSVLAWAAYGADGRLLNWGPISGGKEYCKDVKAPCPTIPGRFVVYRKGGADCKSKKFPIGKGGAKMPYCMFYHRGYALHGSYKVPGYNDSHGCVRVPVEDARWLASDFVNTGETIINIDQGLPASYAEWQAAEERRAQQQKKPKNSNSFFSWFR